MREQTTLLGSTVKKDKKASDLIEVLATILTKPTHTRLEADTGGSMLSHQAVTQRLLRLMSIARDDTSDMTAKQTEKIVMKLTDPEKLTILSNLSMKGPLRRDYVDEMQRLFLKVKGEKAYRKIFGDEDPPEPNPYIDLWKGK